MKKMLLILLLAVVSMCSACNKSKQADPCNGFAWLTAPVKVGIIFKDKVTGENFFLSRNIDVSKITITPAETLTIQTNRNPDTYGALSFLAEQTKKGDIKYTINIPEVGALNLSHTNVEKATGTPCHPSMIIVGEPVIEGYSYTVENKDTYYIITVKM